jgi:TonB family protein
MRNFILFFLFLFSVNVLAQDTIFYNKEKERVKSKEKAEFYEISYKNTALNTMTKKEFCAKNDQIRKEINYFIKDDDKEIKDGVYRKWNKKGLLIEETFYKNGAFDGTMRKYYSNGKLRRDDLYDRGNLISGKCYTKQGADTIYFPPEVAPQYKGGNTALYKYLSKTINYPEDARKKGKGGRVLVQFFVEKDASVSDVKVIQSSGNYEIDAEAVRVVRGTDKNWIPGKNEGKLARVSFVLPIVFRQ